MVKHATFDQHLVQRDITLATYATRREYRYPSLSSSSLFTASDSADVPEAPEALLLDLWPIVILAKDVKEPL